MSVQEANIINDILCAEWVVIGTPDQVLRVRGIDSDGR
jgi:hypothetical protein